MSIPVAATNAVTRILWAKVDFHLAEFILMNGGG